MTSFLQHNKAIFLFLSKKRHSYLKYIIALKHSLSYALCEHQAAFGKKIKSFSVRKLRDLVI